MNAEQSISGKEESEEQLDSQIAGSEGLWDMTAVEITTKLTRDKNAKTPEQIKKEKILKEKQLKQKITEEILAADPVSEMDTRLYSGYLAQQSEKSKSAVEIQQDKEKAEQIAKNRAEAAKQRQKEEKDANLRYIQKQEAEEKAMIKQGDMARIQKKNEKDLASIQDLQNLEKLSRSDSGSAQVDSLTEQAEVEEKARAQEEQVQTQVDEIKNAVETQVEDENQAKIKELSAKLGVSVLESDSKLQSKAEIAKEFVARAIKAGKSKEEINKALTE